MKKAPHWGAFSIRFYASDIRFCLSPTGECVLEFSLYINLSVRCNKATQRKVGINYSIPIARLNFGRTPMPFVRWGGS